MDSEQVLFIVARQAPMGCGTFSLPVPELLERGGLKRPELLAAVGSTALVHDWKITLDLSSDRVLYQRMSRDVTAPIVRMAQTKPTPRTALPTPPVIDPIAVGQRAREYQDAERKAGREISATQAVAHVTAKRT